MKGIEVVRVDGQGSGVMVQAGLGSVGITVNAREGQWTFGGTFWITVEETDRLVEALRQIAAHVRNELDE